MRRALLAIDDNAATLTSTRNYITKLNVYVQSIYSIADSMPTSDANAQLRAIRARRATNAARLKARFTFIDISFLFFNFNLDFDFDSN